MSKDREFSIIFPDEKYDCENLEIALALINSYAEIGIMLAVSLEQFQTMVVLGNLALAIDTETNIPIGTAAISFHYSNGVREFGSWAIEEKWKHKGVGKQLLKAVIEKYQNIQVIALGNDNSSPIFRKLGAQELDQQVMHSDVFKPCQSCGCDKTKLLPGNKCVDTIFDLSTIEFD